MLHLSSVKTKALCENSRSAKTDVAEFRVVSIRQWLKIEFSNLPITVPLRRHCIVLLFGWRWRRIVVKKMVAKSN